MRLRLVALMAVGVLACSGGDDPLSTGEARDLDQAEQRWSERSFTDYSYQIRRLCFCPAEYNEWSTVEVRQGVVVAVRLPGDTMSIPADRLDEWPIVDALFTSIRQAAGQTMVEDVSASYDLTLGYPLSIDVQYPENIADGGGRTETRYLNPLPQP